MNEPFFDRIPQLERRVRFWRNTSFVLAAILLSGLVTGLFFFSVERQHAAMREAEAARRALQEAKER